MIALLARTLTFTYSYLLFLTLDASVDSLTLALLPFTTPFGLDGSNILITKDLKFKQKKLDDSKQLIRYEIIGLRVI